MKPLCKQRLYIIMLFHIVSRFTWTTLGVQSLSTIAYAQHQRSIPITIISGFLGSGKTTFLQHLLQNQDGLRIAVIVNDVASVNIDSKLVSGQSAVSASAGPAGMVELANGCACCNLAGELLASVGELITLSDLREQAALFDDGNEDEDDDAGTLAANKGGFDHIVVELSGVADPRAIRANFQEAQMYGMPLMNRVQLDTMVTLVDCTSFLQNLRSAKGATAKDAPELFYRDDVEREAMESQSPEWDDVPAQLMQALGGGNVMFGMEHESGVSELLIDQTEVADVVLLNKVDQVENDQTIDEIKDIVQLLNPNAKVIQTQFGRVGDIKSVLGAFGGLGAADAGTVDDHKDAVAAAKAKKHEHEEESNAHDHSHRHEHALSHDHGHEQSHSNDDSNEIVSTHDHSHASQSGSHSHSHTHDDNEEACDDPDCTDPTHDHSHDHNHAKLLGNIGTFVYSARRPFHPIRLSQLIAHLPVARGIPDEVPEVEEQRIEFTDNAKKYLGKLLRSKGFVWLADSNVAANYWAHAGASFEMQCLGSWWATLPRDQWPAEATSTILSDFDVTDYNDEMELSKSVGDRRQELVFIGSGMGDATVQKVLGDTLDQCLVSDEEWDSYRSCAGDEEKLKAAFGNPIRARIINY